MHYYLLKLKIDHNVVKANLYFLNLHLLIFLTKCNFLNQNSINHLKNFHLFLYHQICINSYLIYMMNDLFFLMEYFYYFHYLIYYLHFLLYFLYF